MLEARCIEVDESARKLVEEQDTRLSNEQCRSLIALHRQLLYEHHDFLASQHPAASPALRRLATKYGMPTRMWERGVQDFFDLIRQREPMSVKHMHAFLQDAYFILGQLIISVPSMMDEWTQMIKALDEYDLILKDLGIRSAKAPARPSTYDGFSTNIDSPASLSKMDRMRWIDPSPGLSDFEFGDWYFHNENPASSPERDFTYLCSLTDQLHLPSWAVDTLVGWLIFGQSIASESFNIYSKVFMNLSLAVTKHAEWIIRSPRII